MRGNGKKQMNKIINALLLGIIALVVGELAWSQGNPPPYGAYLYSAGTWSPATSTDSAGALAFNPPPAALYCLNTGTNQWVPASSACFGGGATTNPLTANSSGGAAPGSTFNGGAAVTFDYHSFGAQANLLLIKGTYADGDLCTYTLSGTLFNCNTAANTLSVSYAATAGSAAPNAAINLAAGGAGGVTGILPTANIATAQTTRTVTITDIAPVTGDDLLIVALNPATAVQLTRLSCGVTGTTSVITNLVSGGNSLIADMTATAGDVNHVVVTTWVSGSCSSQTTYCPVAAHTPVTLHIGTISGTPTSLSCALDYTVN